MPRPSDVTSISGTTADISEASMRQCLEDWSARHNESIQQLASQVQRLEELLDLVAPRHSKWRTPTLGAASFDQERTHQFHLSQSHSKLSRAPSIPAHKISNNSSLFDEVEMQEYQEHRRASIEQEVRRSSIAEESMFAAVQKVTCVWRPLRLALAAVQPVRTRLQALAQSSVFDVVCAVMIMANAVAVGAETEYMVDHAHTSPTLVRVYMMLNGWFIVEWLLRFFAEGCAFYYNKEWRWNIFDTVLVATSLIDMSIETLNTGGMLLGRVLRAVRIFRIIRTIRIVRMLVYMREFRKMAVSLLASVQTLFWSLLLLFFVLYTFAIWLTQAVSLHLHEHPEARHTDGLEEYYGSLWITIYTLYQCISTGLNWGIIVQPLQAVDSGTVILFIIFISISFFGVLNIVTSVFVESAMQTTQRYRDLMLEESRRQRSTYVSHLKEIFSAIDTDSSGSISLQELKNFIKTEQPQLRDYFAALEINASNLHALFKLLDHDESGAIDLNEFCDGCMRLKGEAQSFDLNCVLYENRRFQKKFVQRLKRIEDTIHSVTTSQALLARLAGLGGGNQKMACE